jgi:SPP1 gp7 family putative phage head morphogenesis protein
MQRSIDFSLNDQLLETQTDSIPFNWYWKKDIEQPYRQGTIEETRDYSQEIAVAASAGFFAKKIRPEAPAVEQVLLSENYRSNLSAKYVDNFGSIKGLSNDTSKQVYRVISSGIKAGVNPSTIAAEISGRFKVAKSSAKRLADTEVNKAYNDSKLDTAKELSSQTGLRSGVVHISALLPTTRTGHAARHGNAYTVEDQRQWWETGANRINCHCTTRSILIDRNGEVINTTLESELEEERAFFG